MKYEMNALFTYSKTNDRSYLCVDFNTGRYTATSFKVMLEANGIGVRLFRVR